MATYRVRPGDTLSLIALEQLGNAGKWRLLAEINHLADSDRIRVGQELIIPDTLPATAPPAPTVPAGPGPNTNIHIHIDGRTVFAIDQSNVWHRVGQLKRKGLYRIGNQDPESFIASNRGLLESLALSGSEIRVIAATAENEGNLDAINTWDSHFLSFGIFQWTSGGTGDAGELPALLARVKAQMPEKFEIFFRRHGLDVEDVGRVTGWLSLDGQRLVTAEDKDVLRDHLWAYRFSIAGMDDDVKAAQIAHAIARIRNFYFSRSIHLDRIALSELITSEYGVALLLDNHVNRPGYVFACVGEAIRARGITPQQLTDGSSELESAVIEEYLSIRESFGKNPMTDARQRAAVTAAYRDRGEISALRGSFELGGTLASQSLPLL